MYEPADGSSNITLPNSLALHDVYSYQYEITKLQAGVLYTIYVRAVQVFNDLKSYSSWVTVNKTTSKFSLHQIVDK